MELENSSEMRMIALKARQVKCEQGENFIWNEIRKAAAKGEFELWAYKMVDDNGDGVEITVSEDFIKQLKKLGYKVYPREARNWDDLHRFYKGLLYISWKK